AADGVDRFLDVVRNLALHLLRRRAGQASGHDDDRKVNGGELVDSELREREDADDGQREDEDRCEDRPADTKRCKPLHDGSSYSPTATRAPSLSCVTLLVATVSPSARPLVTSTRSSAP